MLFTALLAVSALAFAALRYALRHGFWLPMGRGMFVQRFYAPVNHSDEQLLALQEAMRQVCLASIGSVLDYPVLQAKTASDLRAELHNKVIMTVYSAKLKRVVAFHMAFWTKHNVHIGLVMVDKDAQGKGLQQVSLLNTIMLTFDWFCIRFRMSDLGYSSSAFRSVHATTLSPPLLLLSFPLESRVHARALSQQAQYSPVSSYRILSIMSETVYKAYPNLYYKVKPERWHFEIAAELLHYYRQDMGISATAEFDPSTFVVRGSNAQTGGGAHELVAHTKTRTSRMGIAAQYLDDLMQPEDEQLYVGEGSIFVFLWRQLPVLPKLPTIFSWTAIMGIFFVHNYIVPNVSWFTPTILRLMGMNYIRQGQRPADPTLWVANHYTYLDAVLLHGTNPNLQIVAKADLKDEVPDNMFTRFMFRVFNRGGFMWYNRNGDDTINDRITAKLQEGKSVIIFAEGTSQRSGPPCEMKRGVLRLAEQNNVPIVPVGLRYSMPIGLSKGDKTMRNFASIVRMRNLQAGVKFGEPMTNVDDMELIRYVMTIRFHHG
ncbi:uncharacterized protein MONBRDRAFT_11599 [Monosiga brevicollis MX1]|uniref:Phospholipid/glycerol acyltransferase domain-containing protein n=1 Tax=Monosiga brevicollis TaxID=81824 RepID=A9V9R1_MONBE|nr:uncharacterized protein MONBRDRAFT_11599 [Monosiga brevicollis MX1]EDQ85710.1 predicted protein [Monosiga brevicollis MX1]|eukprot:XP_001749425.1 hypothetical protein [Monosiga brevicollis MX1]